MREVRAMRAQGLAAYFTIDAGPHVKVITSQSDSATVEARLAAVDGVRRTIVAQPGDGARVVAS